MARAGPGSGPGLARGGAALMSRVLEGSSWDHWSAPGWVLEAGYPGAARLASWFWVGGVACRPAGAGAGGAGLGAGARAAGRHSGLAGHRGPWNSSLADAAARCWSIIARGRWGYRIFLGPQLAAAASAGGAAGGAGGPGRGSRGAALLWPRAVGPCDDNRWPAVLSDFEAL